LSLEEYRKESLFAPTLSARTRLNVISNSKDTGAGVGYKVEIHESKLVESQGGWHMRLRKWSIRCSRIIKSSYDPL
jgi:hypothetical protein